jgi:hypothetical protein
MTEFTYTLPIAEKILIIRNGGFKVVSREEAQAVFAVPDDMPGAYIIYSEDWFFADGPDYGMIEAGDDPIILEASFAEAYSDDSWGDVSPEVAEKIIADMTKSLRRKHLRVVE